MSFFPQGAFYGLGLMGQSLSAFQYAENITADDIANVNTPGASQQQVVFAPAQPIAGSPTYGSGGMAGDGVSIEEVERIHSNAYDSLFRGASSSQNYFQTEQTALDSLQQSFGDPTSGVSAQYSAFQSAVNALVSQSSTGQSSSLNQAVLTAAQSLAGALNTDASAVSQQEQSVVQQAGSIVQTVNGLLQQIASLNGQIRSASAAGDSPNTYEDERDNDIDTLSQYVSTQTSIQADGSALVSVNGQALVNDTVAYQLSAPAIVTGSDGQPTLQINFAGASASSSSSGVPLGSGQLAALADLYNNKLANYNTQLNQFASSLANEVNRVTTASYTSSGLAGGALFTPSTAGQTITAANISVGITNPSALPTVLGSTAAGSLVQALNSANNTVDPSAQLTNNASLANSPAAALTGSLTITVNGVAQTFNYNTGAGGNADTIDDFISSFNAGNYGVTASFDSSSQEIVFSRDPTNEGLALRAAQGNNPETADFTITDSNYNAATPNTSLLGALGSGGINGVDQNSGNAFGASSEGTANALVTLFNANVGVPALQTTSGAGVSATAGVPVTIELPVNTPYANTVEVGQQLTIDAQTGGGPPQETVTVSGVSFANGVESVTFTPQYSHAANFSVASAPTQTLGEFYGSFVTQVGLDAQTAATGTTTQTDLANNINTTRQGISGINVDDETQNLIEYQSAYSAAAQTINALNQILTTTINSLGVGSAG
jgi:flagellar hook-associated protein 1